MAQKRCVCLSFGVLSLIIGAALIVVLGGIFKPLVNKRIDDGVKDNLYLDYNNYDEKDRNDFLLTMKDYDFYYFNIQNYAAVKNHVLNGPGTPTYDRPSTAPVINVQELGPFTYRYFEQKYNVTIENTELGEVMSYNSYWWRNPVEGNTDNVTQVCTVNPLYLGALGAVWQLSYSSAAVAGPGFDEFSLERQLYARFVPQIGAQVIPALISTMTTSLPPLLMPFYFNLVILGLVGTNFPNVSALIDHWATLSGGQTLAESADPRLIHFEYINVTGVAMGTHVAARLWDNTQTDFSLTNYPLGVLGLLDLLQNAQTNPTLVGTFAAAIGPAWVQDFGVQPTTPDIVGLLGGLGMYVQVLTANVSTENTSTSGYLYYTLTSLPPNCYNTDPINNIQDLIYTQLGTGCLGPLTQPTPKVFDVTNDPLRFLGFYASSNLTFYGFELAFYGMPLQLSQAQAFFNALTSQGTSFYGGLLQLVVDPTGTIPPASLGLLQFLNTMGFNFNLTSAAAAKSQALTLLDYLGSIVATRIFTTLGDNNSGFFTCRTAMEFTKGYLDAALGLPWPGFFPDVPLAESYTGQNKLPEKWFTGKDNADIARMYYAKYDVTSFKTLADIGRGDECPYVSPTNTTPVCRDVWAANYGDNGITTTFTYVSTFSFFGPFQEGKDPKPLVAWSTDLVRNVNLSYVADEDVKGIKTRRYDLAAEMLQARTQNPANIPYRMDRQGVAPMKFATKGNLWGFTLSRPHFVEADNTVRNTVTGLDLDPNNEYKYTTSIWVEPLSGAAMKGSKKLQASTHLKRVTFDSRHGARLFGGAQSEIFLPIFWATERAILNDSQASDFKNSIYFYRDLAKVLSPVGYAVGAVLFAAGAAMLFLGIKTQAVTSGASQLKSTTTL